MRSKKQRVVNNPPNSEIAQMRNLTRPAWMKADGRCGMCLASRPWVSVYGVLVCEACHPPARSEVLDRVLNDSEIPQLLRGDLMWTPKAVE